MEWTCACCGQLAEVAKWTDLTDLGWTLNGAGDCICVSCTMRQWPAFRAPAARPRPHLALVK